MSILSILNPLIKILMVALLFVKLHLLASVLNWWIYAASDSFSLCYISIKWDMEVWISELQIFSHNKSSISSQEWPDVIASVIKVWVKPFALAWASLVLLSAVRSAAVSMSTSQSSRSVVSYPFNTGISCSKEVVRLVCFWPEHKVFV